MIQLVSALGLEKRPKLVVEVMSTALVLNLVKFSWPLLGFGEWLGREKKTFSKGD